MSSPTSIHDVLIASQNETQDQLLHYGVLGMKWGRRKSLGGSTKSPVLRNPKTGGILRRLRRKNTMGTGGTKRLSKRKMKRLIKQQEAKRLEDLNRKERKREASYIREYENRDKMSTKAIKARTDRLKAEYEFEKVVYQRANDRAKRAQEEATAKAEKRAKRVKTALQLGGAIATAAGTYGVEKLLNEPTKAEFGLRNSDEGKFHATKEAYADYVAATKQYKKDLNTAKSINTLLKNVGGGLSKSGK